MLNKKECYLKIGDKLEVINNNVYINGTKLNLLGSGVDGKVYKYEDKAIKLYHDDYQIKGHLNIEQIEILCSIITKNIILPKERLGSNLNNFGYVMNYIDLDTKKDILLEDIYKLTKEIKTLEEELILIGKNHFLLDDFKVENFVFNDNLYLLDPDSFIFDKKVDFSKKNLELFVWYFIRDIIFSLNNDINKKERIIFLRKMHYLYKNSEYYLFSDFLKEKFYDCNLYDVRDYFINKKIKVLNKF